MWTAVIIAVTALCDLTIATVENVVVTKVPSRQIYSGQSFSLVCTAVVSPSSSDSVQMNWYNGTAEVVDGHITHIIDPVQTQSESTYYSVLEVSLALPQTSWYTCGATTGEETPVYDNIHITVQNTGLLTSVTVQYPNTSLYAGIPFTASCHVNVPTFVSLPVKIKWTKNGIALPESMHYDTDTIFVNTTAAILSRLWVNESHPGIAHYTCSCEAQHNTYLVFEVTHSTPGLFIQAYPTPELTVTTEPANGPKINLPYTLRCTASSSTGSPLQLSWTDQNGAPIDKTNERISLLSNEGNTSRSLSLIFTEVVPEDEGTYHCSAVLELTQLQHSISISRSILLTAPAQVVRIHISQFPVDSQVWHVGMDSALLCYIEMSSPGFLPILTWRNSTGTINTNATMKISEISTVTSTLLLSVLEFISLQPHSQLYYCNADIAGVVKTVWHYVHVENEPSQISAEIISSSLGEPVFTGQPLSLQCLVSIPPTLHALPVITWQRESGAYVTNSSNRTVQLPVENGTHAVSTIDFSPVLLSDSGEYTCTATFRVLRVTQEISTHTNYQLHLRAPKPEVNIVSREFIQDGQIFYRLTCTIAITQASTFPIQITTNWSTIDKSGSSAQISRDLLSAVDVHICNHLYSQEIVFSESSLLTEAKAITCEALFSVNNMYVVGASNKATVAVASLFAAIPVGAPRDLAAIHAGSYWAEVQWTSDTDATFKVMYGKTESRLVQLTSTVYRHTNLSSVGRHVFKALLTNMQPATQYWYRVVAFIHEVSNSSSVSSIKTNETAPTGSPVNFTAMLLGNTHLRFSWLPPEEDKRNGNITGYKLQCSPSLGSELITTMETTVVATGVLLHTDYICSVWASTRAGEGPSTTIQFPFSTFNGTVDVGATREQELPLTRVQFFLVIATMALVCLIIIICVVVTVFSCYKVKIKSINKRQQAAIKTSASLFSIARAPLVGTQQSFSNSRYVLSDEVQRAWSQAPRRENGPAEAESSM